MIFYHIPDLFWFLSSTGMVVGDSANIYLGNFTYGSGCLDFNFESSSTNVFRLKIELKSLSEAELNSIDISSKAFPGRS